MKLQLTALALSSAVSFGSLSAAISADDLSATASVAYESNYVFRGGQQYNDAGAIQPTVDLSAPVMEGNAYVGFWGSYTDSLASDQNEGFNETDLYIGYEQSLTDYASVDGGFTYYGIEDEGGTDRWKEIYLGLTFDGLMPEGVPELSPSVYGYWNFSGDALTVEASIGHTIALEQIHPDVSLDLGANAAFVDFGDANGDQVAGEPEDGYSYWGANADLVYDINEVASFSLGVRYAGNNNDFDSTTRAGENLYIFDETDEILWWGMSATFGF